MVIRQLSVFLENRAGRLAEITGLLSENNINLRAINIAEASDYGVLRLIVDHTDQAAEALRKQGVIFSVTPVAAVAVPDIAGGLNQLLKLIAGEGLDIEYMYSVFGREDGKAYMIFKVSDPQKLDRLLEQSSFHSAGKRELGPE